MALPLTGVSPVSGLPYGLHTVGQAAYPGAMLTQTGIEYPAEWPCMSYGEAALLLGGHLVLAINEKNWRGEFLDLFSLLHKETDPVARVGDPAPDPHITRKRKID